MAFVLRGTGVDCKCLWAGEGRTVYLLYRREQMEKLLKSRETRSFFQSFGYSSMELSKALSGLAARYGLYAEGKGEFPHEIGLILEYPIWDVKGFIEHKGRDFLFSGYWKVYREPVGSQKTFRSLHGGQRAGGEGSGAGKSWGRSARPFWDSRSAASWRRLKAGGLCLRAV